MTVPETQNVGVRKKRWVVCFENTILDLDLPIYEKMVYIVLCSHAKKDGPCYPSVKKIAAEASCSRTKVFEALKTLEERGIIARSNQVYEGRGQTSNLYEITDIVPRPPHGRGGAPDGPPRPPNGRGGARVECPRSATRTGGVRAADAPLNVLEQDPVNKTKEHIPPAPGGGGGAEPGCTEHEHREHGAAEAGAGEAYIPGGDLREAVLSAFSEILPGLPRAGKLTAARARAINRRVLEDPARRSPGWWRKYFERVKNFPWLMGRNPHGWEATFDWLIGEGGMQKVIEGGFTAAPGAGYSPGELLEWQRRYTDERGIVDAKALLRDWRARTAGTEGSR